MYGDAAMQATHTPLQGNLAINKVSGDHLGQVLKSSLEDRFDPEGIKFARPDYRLQASVVKSLIPAVVRSDGTILRYDIHIDSDFQLIDNNSGKILLGGSIKRIGSYNVAINANFATYEGEQDTTQRIVKELAEDYVLRISSYFATAPQKGPLVPLDAVPAAIEQPVPSTTPVSTHMY